MKTVALFGKGALACDVARYFLKGFEWGGKWQLKTVCPVKPEPTWTPSLETYIAIQKSLHGHRYISVVESGNYRHVKKAHDLNLSIFYDRIFKDDWLERHGPVVNLHGGLLPEYRGCKPIPWALKNKERHAGATMHWINCHEIDAGPIINQVRFVIDHKQEEVREVYDRMLKYAYTMFEDTIERIDEIRPYAQDEFKARYYSAKDAAKLGDRSNWTRETSK